MAGHTRMIAALLIGVGLAGVLTWRLAAAPAPQRTFSDLIVEEAAFDDTARLLKIRKLSGSLTVHGGFESFHLAAALYQKGAADPKVLAGGGLSFPRTEKAQEVRFLLAGLDLDHLRIGDSEPDTSRLMMTLAAGRGTIATAGPAERDLPKEQFDAGRIHGQILFNDRHLPRGRAAGTVKVPLAAWITGEGPIGGFSEEDFDIDDFAAHQLELGEDPERAVLVLYLECRPG